MFRFVGRRTAAVSHMQHGLNGERIHLVAGRWFKRTDARCEIHVGDGSDFSEFVSERRRCDVRMSVCMRRLYILVEFRNVKSRCPLGKMEVYELLVLNVTQRYNKKPWKETFFIKSSRDERRRIRHPVRRV